MTRLANRTQEIAQFLKMVEGRCEERIFLIEAPSGCGETSLLMRFEAECPEPVRSAWVDLKRSFGAYTLRWLTFTLSE
jgi:ATP/maltotriose-dependent transcriptional regulator MalT